MLPIKKKITEQLLTECTTELQNILKLWLLLLGLKAKNIWWCCV